MKTVWKFNIGYDDYSYISVPIGAVIISFQTQYERPTLWFLCDPDEPKKEVRKFRLAGTGHNITEENLAFVGTVQLRGGQIVFHLFEILP